MILLNFIMRKIVVVMILTVAVVSCKSKYRKAADEIAANMPKPVNMNVGKEKYTVDIPQGWTTENRNVYGIDYFYLMAPKTIDDPNTSINIANEFMQNMSLEDYLARTIVSLKKAIPSAEILGQGKIEANDLKGAWLSYDMEQQGIEATLIAYIFPKDGIAYMLTAGTQRKDILKHKITFDKVARSFKIVP
jgi:hypothetical protein